MIKNIFSNANKNVFQSTNNLESKNNPKTEVNQRPFVKQALRSRSRDYILVTKTKKKKTCKICKEIISITKNQSKERFQLRNQSNMGIGIPP